MDLKILEKHKTEKTHKKFRGEKSARIAARNAAHWKSALVFIAALTFAFTGIFAQEISPENELSQAKFFDKSKVREISIDGRCAQFFYGSRYYNLRFSEESIAALSSACQKYFSDFDGKKLSRKEKKSKEKYGYFQARIEWGTTRQNLAEYANLRAAAGYVFSGRSPYFAISVPNSPSESEDVSPTLFSSGEVVLLFSKSQISQFIEALK